jgi:hypothetical protein
LRNKKVKESVLRADLIKYSRQMGIIDCEIPELVFYGEEFKQKVNESTMVSKYGFPQYHRGGKHTRFGGICDIYSRLIFVNLRKNSVSRKSIRDLRNTLVHELVHYRFMYMSHGRKFEKRIKEILQGKQFPRKHIEIPNYDGLTAFV